jgi:DNA polymerase I-like protein with 3'-5' exonuclease and polymerase domains
MTFPNLENEKVIAFDIETFDPELKEKGPGVRRTGYMVGISIATLTDSWYFPFGHTEGTNLPREAVLAWCRKELCRPGQVKIGANILYDLDYLYAAGVHVTGPFHDICVAEPLIDENQFSFGLDACAKKYLGLSKKDDVLVAECARRNLKGKPVTWCWLLPPKFTADYARADCELPLKIYPKQREILERENLMSVYRMEMDLLPLLLQMRQGGVRIDEAKIQPAIDFFQDKLDGIKMGLGDLNYNSGKQLAAHFDELGLPYSKTPDGNPCFNREALEGMDLNVARDILAARKYDKFIGTFLKGHLQGSLVKGRVHCCFNSVKSDEYGTVSGRLSCSNPNLQQIPKRDADIAKILRSMFIPEEGELWGRLDYSQIELRFLAHYARGEGATAIRETFANNPNQDFHQWCADIAQIPRGDAKRINFGLVYGMGAKQLASELGMTLEEAKSFLDDYHTAMPFLKFTMDYAINTADKRGFIRTVMHRRRRFPMWEPTNWDLSKSVTPLRDRVKMEQLVKSRGSHGVKRAFTYRALNSVLQGGAADMMKKAMVDSYKAGVFDVLKPLTTVHDEMNVSVPDTPEGREAFKELKHIMETCMPEIRVPVIADGGLGKNWSDADNG